MPRDDHPYGYRIRNDRCEGIYIEKVSSTVLSLVSLTKPIGEFDINEREHLSIKWRVPGDGEIRIRANGLKSRLYYRMDSIQPLGSMSYLWPADVLSALNINKNNIGLVAWINHPKNDQERIYVPLEIGSTNQQLEKNKYEISLLPGRELIEVFISVAIVDSEGNPKTTIMEDIPLQYGYYPPGRVVKFSLENLKTSGIVYVQVGAKLSDGGVTNIDFFLLIRKNKDIS